MSTRRQSAAPLKKLHFSTSNDNETSLAEIRVSHGVSEGSQVQDVIEDVNYDMAPENRSPPGSTQMHTSPFSGPVSLPNSDMIQGVVVTETGQFPRKSKYTGRSSGQVLAKSAEELFKHQVAHIDVMSFFCPLMSFGEEIKVPPSHCCSLVDKETADRCVNSK